MGVPKATKRTSVTDGAGAMGGKIRSSTGMNLRKSSAGRSGADKVTMSAKKRVMATEYAKRKSSKSTVSNGVAESLNAAAMDVDDSDA